MPAIQMRFKGLKELEQRVKKRMKPKAYQNAMHKALEEGKRRAKDLCPVRTGFMRSQIHYKKVGNLAYRFTCDCKYASFNEWGWYGIPEVGTADKPVHYKGGYRPFMRPGALYATHKMKKYLSHVLVHGRFY